MKICFISTAWFEYESGGGVVCLYNLYNLGREYIDEMHFLIPNPDENKIRVEKQGNVYIHRLPFIMFFFKGKRLSKKAKKLYNYLEEIIPKYGIDLIETDSFGKVSAYFLAVNMVGIKYNLPLIERLHENPRDDLPIAMYKNLFLNKIVCTSKHLSQSLFERGVSSKRLDICYPGIDTNKFSKSDDDLREELGFKQNDIVVMQASKIESVVGLNLIEEKGISTLLNAFSLIAEQYDNVKLLLATAKPNPKQQQAYDKALGMIEKYCRIYNIEDKVKVKIFSHEEMPKAYNTCDIFAMASQYETFGLAYAESMACEKPAIGSDTTGASEIIFNGENGYLVEPDNPVELSKSLSLLIDDKNHLKELGKNARERILERFKIETMMENLVDIYKDVLR